jgi:hypothetical protein
VSVNWASQSKRRGLRPATNRTADFGKDLTALFQRSSQPEALFRHIFGDDDGFLVTFTGQQARFSRPDARHNELAGTRQRSWSYATEVVEAACYLLEESAAQRDAYVAVHLFREPDNRRASNAVPTLQSLWLDEDDGHYPELGPQPTAIVASSASRRHLYWQLTQKVSAEWAVTMNRRIAKWADGDIGKAGLASVLRVPGTANYKRHPQVDPVTMEITEAGPWDPEVLDQAIPIGTPTSSRATSEPYDGPGVELAEFLGGVEVLSEAADGLGYKLAIVCPWVSEHTGGDRSGTRVGQRENGALWFHCDHAHCHGRTWTDFKLAVRGWVIEVSRPTRNPNNQRKVKITRE